MVTDPALVIIDTVFLICVGVLPLALRVQLALAKQMCSTPKEARPGLRAFVVHRNDAHLVNPALVVNDPTILAMLLALHGRLLVRTHIVIAVFSCLVELSRRS